MYFKNSPEIEQKFKKKNPKTKSLIGNNHRQRSLKFKLKTSNTVLPTLTPRAFRDVAFHKLTKFSFDFDVVVQQSIGSCLSYGTFCSKIPTNLYYK